MHFKEMKTNAGPHLPSLAVPAARAPIKPHLLVSQCWALSHPMALTDLRFLNGASGGLALIFQLPCPLPPSSTPTLGHQFIGMAVNSFPSFHIHTCPRHPAWSRAWLMLPIWAPPL